MMFKSISVRTYVCRLSMLAVMTTILSLSAEKAFSQVSVSPTRVIIDNRNPSTELSVTNPTSEQVEVTASAEYKLQRSDAIGGIMFDTTVTDLEATKSCRQWMKIFPKKFTLAPNQSRTIRVICSAPSSIEDGEYWGRVNLLSEPLGRPKPVPDDTLSTMKVQATLLLAVNLPVAYRKGKVETALAIDSVFAIRDSAKMRVLMNQRRLGNSAYRGTVTGTITKSDGTVVETRNDQSTVEFTLRRPILFPVIPDGAYTLTLDAKSVRTGSVSEAVIPAPELTKSYTLVVAGNDISVTPKE